MSFLDSLDPRVKDYMMKKREEEQALKEQTQGGVGQNYIAPALAAIGAGFSGRDPMAAGMGMQQKVQADKDRIINNFQKEKAGELEGLNLSRQLKQDDIADQKYQREEKSFAEKEDANSDLSKMYQSIASKYPGGQALMGKSASQIEKILPSIKDIADLEARKQENYLKRVENKENKQNTLNLKNEEKLMELSTPFGVARTKDDAKKLKDGYEEKKVFDDKLQQMIALREKHDGGALMNREDVARGKQLSKDLLLTYKNMAKLGVLSQADENIINAIIPKDPLEYNSPLAAMQGQDPILNNLKKFKADSDKDFLTRIDTRVREGTKVPIEKTQDAIEQEKVISKKLYSPKSNKTKIIYSDGTEEILDGKK